MKRALSRTTLVAMVVLGLAPVGCGSLVDKTADGFSYIMYPDRDARRAEREAADDAKCRQYGFEPGTEGYGNCRLKLDQIRATKVAGIQAGRKK